MIKAHLLLGFSIISPPMLKVTFLFRGDGDFPGNQRFLENRVFSSVSIPFKVNKFCWLEDPHIHIQEKDL